MTDSISQQILLEMVCVSRYIGVILLLSAREASCVEWQLAQLYVICIWFTPQACKFASSVT